MMVRQVWQNKISVPCLSPTGEPTDLAQACNSMRMSSTTYAFTTPELITECLDVWMQQSTSRTFYAASSSNTCQSWLRL